MKKFFLKTFGCQMNKSDSERIAGVLLHAGLDPVPEPQQADVLIFNTCCVRKRAEDRLLGNVNSLRRLKNKDKKVIIAIGGCFAQKQKEEIFALMPHVDVVFGTHNISHLPRLISAAQQNSHKVCEILESCDALPNKLPAERDSKFFGWVPVSVGCNNFCSYCVVPYVRGKEISLPLEQIKTDVGKFVSHGGKEITLLGQNVNSYGRDLYGESRFGQLLKELGSVEGLERIRFTTSHPKDLNDRIIDAISSQSKVCEHVHLPIQAGSDRILKLMNRGYSGSDYLQIVEKIREGIPECSLSTDIMVGFPGEKGEDFERTLHMVDKVRFDQVFMFIYSPREGTPALGLPDQVLEASKKERFLRLVELQDKITWEINKNLVGRRYKILTEGIAKKDKQMLFGRTRTNKVVNFPGAGISIGTTVEVRIVKASKKSLMGEVC